MLVWFGSPLFKYWQEDLMNVMWSVIVVIFELVSLAHTLAADCWHCITSWCLVPVQLVAAWFSLFDAIMLILLLPLFDRVIYPWIERRTGNPVSISRRILLGMIFAMAAMLTAGVVEHYRLRAFWPYPDHPCKNFSISQDIGNLGNMLAVIMLWNLTFNSFTAPPSTLPPPPNVLAEKSHTRL